MIVNQTCHVLFSLSADKSYFHHQDTNSSTCWLVFKPRSIPFSVFWIRARTGTCPSRPVAAHTVEDALHGHIRSSLMRERCPSSLAFNSGQHADDLLEAKHVVSYHDACMATGKMALARKDGNGIYPSRYRRNVLFPATEKLSRSR